MRPLYSLPSNCYLEGRNFIAKDIQRFAIVQANEHKTGIGAVAGLPVFPYLAGLAAVFHEPRRITKSIVFDGHAIANIERTHDSTPSSNLAGTISRRSWSTTAHSPFTWSTLA